MRVWVDGVKPDRGISPNLREIDDKDCEIDGIDVCGGIGIRDVIDI